MMVFTGHAFTVTVRHGRHGSPGPLREDLEAGPRQPAKGPSTVLHAIAGRVVDDWPSPRPFRPTSPSTASSTRSSRATSPG
jgi:magnesium transporter